MLRARENPLSWALVDDTHRLIRVKPPFRFQAKPQAHLQKWGALRLQCLRVLKKPKTPFAYYNSHIGSYFELTLADLCWFPSFWVFRCPGSQVATKEILRFEALWLKHFKDTRGDVLKAGWGRKNDLDDRKSGIESGSKTWLCQWLGMMMMMMMRSNDHLRNCV